MASEPKSNEFRNMRYVLASCLETSCGHSGSINVDHLPDIFPVPDVFAGPPVLGVRLAEGEDMTGVESGGWARDYGSGT